MWHFKEWASSNTNQFQCVFWPFRLSFEELHSCRTVINIDGTDLYGKYKGAMSIAARVDANDHLFPLHLLF